MLQVQLIFKPCRSYLVLHPRPCGIQIQERERLRESKGREKCVFYLSSSLRNVVAILLKIIAQKCQNMRYELSYFAADSTLTR